MIMLRRIPLLFVIASSLLPLITECFQRQQQQQQRSGDESSSSSSSSSSATTTARPLTLIRQDTIQAIRPLSLPWDNPPGPSKFQCPCPTPEEEEEEESNNNKIEEFGEKFFSTLGTFWAEGLVPTSLVFPDSTSGVMVEEEEGEEEEDFWRSSPSILQTIITR